MFILTIVTTLLLTQVSNGIEYYDPSGFEDDFEVACGNSTHAEMTITYIGEAHSVYAESAAFTCRAEEVAPVQFHLTDAMLNSDCPVQVSESPSITVLDIVIQMTSIRLQDDPVFMITCNYEFGGSQQSDTNGAILGTITKTPIWTMAGNKSAHSNTSLHVYDTNDEAITSTTLGNYIQLRAFMTQQETEVSIKIWNCRGYSGDLSYYMLLAGCGDGSVLKQTRGFYTRAEADLAVLNIDRVSRSSYFKAFLLPGMSTIQFECDYIVCEDTDCDEHSCENREKRDAEPYPRQSTLPKIRTVPLDIRVQEKHPEYTEKQLDYYLYENPNLQEDAVPSVGLVSNGERDTKIDMRKVGLVVCTTVVLLLIIMFTACTVILRRSNNKMKNGEDTARQPVMMELGRP